MKDFRLNVILDRELLINKDLFNTAKDVLESGVEFIQYRDKISSKEDVLINAKKLRGLIRYLIINDYPEVAKEVDAYGVHVGQTDLSVIDARRIVGENKVIGCSASGLDEAIKAEKDGADYIGLGPVFATNTKRGSVPAGLGIIKEASKRIKIPVFAIGGITLDNIDSVLSAGIKRVSIAGAVICSNNIKDTVIRFRHELERIGISSKG